MLLMRITLGLNSFINYCFHRNMSSLSSSVSDLFKNQKQKQHLNGILESSTKGNNLIHHTTETASTMNDYEGSIRTLNGLQSKCKKQSYCLTTLNSLQSNRQTVEKAVGEKDARCNENIPDVIGYLGRTGLSMKDVDKLSVVHVSGTKGKGSTCAMVESILRHHGYRTGLFTSPHLIEVRERIRINGRPLSRDQFTKYFSHVYNKLLNTKTTHGDAMPPYFRFLTVMAIHTFLAERVDVAVFEVGIGGQYDCTNVIRSPVVCGVTSLGMDHMPLLGNTIESIAWHKAGIFKTGVPAVTAPQKPAALRVLEQRSREKQSPLYTAPVIEAYSQGEQVQLGLDGKFQRINAALALQLAHIWMHNHNKTNDERKWTAMGEQTTCLETFPIPSQSLLGLKECIWLGRDQILRYPDVTFYLDGAHTLESIEQCVEWFRACAHSEQRDIQKDVAKVLMFNLTGNRDFTPFIPLLKILRSYRRIRTPF